MASQFGPPFVGPIQNLVESLPADPQTLEGFHAEFDALAAPYHFDNVTATHRLQAARSAPSDVSDSPTSFALP